MCSGLHLKLSVHLKKKSPKQAHSYSRMIIGDSIWPFKKAADRQRTKNEHMKSPRAMAHPAQMSMGDSMWQLKIAG